MDGLIYLAMVSWMLTMSTIRAALDQSQYNPRLLALVDTLHSICKEKSGTDEDSINEVIDGKFTDELKIKKYMTCGLIEVGVMDEKGTIDYEMAAALLPENILDESLAAIRKCDTESMGFPDLHDRVFAIFKCYYDQNPDIFIFF